MSRALNELYLTDEDAYHKMREETDKTHHKTIKEKFPNAFCLGYKKTYNDGLGVTLWSCYGKTAEQNGEYLSFPNR